MAKTLYLIILLSATCAVTATPQSLVNIEVDSWVYPVLDRFVAKGYIFVDTEVRPLTRGEIAAALEPLLRDVHEGEVEVSSVDLDFLNRLRTELRYDLDPELRDDRKHQDLPFIRLRSGLDELDIDVDLEEHLSVNGITCKDESISIDTTLFVSTTSLGLEGYGQLKEKLAFDERLIFSLIEGDEDIKTAYSGQGLRPWKRGTATIERAYMKIAVGPVHFHAGRDRFWWGPGRLGTLIVSSGGEPLDMVGVSAGLWGISARGFTAVLSPDQGIYLSAHRLSVRLPMNTIFGVSEAVLYYRSSFPEPQYVNPLIPYYAAEHNLEQDDNTLWNFDFVSCPGGGLRLYGEFLIDDVQYERNADAPDKLAGIVGFQVADPLGVPDFDVRCEYTRLNKWVYTHRDSLDTYVLSDTPIGDVLGPDADRLVFEMCHRPSPSFEVFLRYLYLRHGEGTLDLPWEEENGDPRPFFPSGKVETTNGLFADLSYRPAWWLFLKTSIGYTRTRNSKALGVLPEEPVDEWQWNTMLRLDL